jgi:hypothetical protein
VLYDAFMPTPEKLNLSEVTQLNRSALITALAAVDQLLELADANENPIERFIKRDQLLELQDQIQSELDLL